MKATGVILFQDQLKQAEKNKLFANAIDKVFFVFDDFTKEELEKKQITAVYKIDLVRNTSNSKQLECAQQWYEELINELELDPENNVILPFINTLFDNSFNPISNGMEQLSQYITDLQLNTLILLGGHHKTEFFSTFLSEGERDFQLFYKRSWFFNYYFYHFFTNELEVVWLSQTNALQMKLAKWMRRKAFPSVLHVLIVVRHLLDRWKHATLKSDLDHKELVFIFVRSAFQFQSLVHVYKEIEKKAKTPVFICYDMLKNVGIVDYVKQQGAFRLISLISFYSLRDFWRINKQNKQRLDTYKTKLSGKPEINNIYGIHAAEILEEIYSYWFDYQTRYELMDRMQQKLSSQTIACYTTETLNHNAALEGIWAKSHGMPIYKIQSVALDYKLYPRNFWTDKVFFVNNDLQQFYRGDSANSKFEYVGPLVYDVNYNSAHPPERLTITILTQPDDYLEDYLNMIQDTIKATENLDRVINIKLHPRDRNEKLYKKMIGDQPVNILTKKSDTMALIKQSSVVISINSVTLFQAIVIGTPTVSVNYKHKYQLDQFDYLSHAVMCKIYNYAELEAYFRDFPAYKEKFQNERLQYFEQYIPGYSGHATEIMVNKTLTERKS